VPELAPPTAPTTAPSLADRARALLKVEPHEWRPLVLSFVYSFSVLAAYYVLRSVRDEMGVQLGPERQAWLYSVVFLVMLAAVPLFGWVVSKFPKRQLVPVLHGFFILNLVLFWLKFQTGAASIPVLSAFYIWVSVFNVFIVSMFWSTMSSLWTSDQAKRLYGVISAGATAGVFCGPVMTSLLVATLGQTNLMLVSAAFLGLGIAVSQALPEAQVQATATTEPPTLATILSGAVNVVRTPYLLHIAIVMFIINLIGTFFYLEQSRIIKLSGMSSIERTQFFAHMDIITASLQIVAQVFLTGRIIERLGLGLAACALPVGAAIGLALLSRYDSLGMVAGLVVAQRAIGYGISTPAMRVFFTVVPPEDKYKAQNFIDTVVFRGGDATGGWLFGPFAKAIGMSLSVMALVSLPLAAVWIWLVLRLGREHAVKASQAKPA
jgi:ATP:ADP antiporter, AAA family